MARLLAFAIAAMLTLVGVDAHAAAPKLKAKQTVTVDASPADVWAVIADFDSISKWHPVVASSPADKGNEKGSVRTLTLKAPGDPSFQEQLTRYHADKMSYSYKILAVDPKVLPVTDYFSTIHVAANKKGGSTVTWHGSFRAPEGVDGDTSVKAITGVYRGGLDNIKKLAEKK